jgi:hypothetical protein
MSAAEREQPDMGGDVEPATMRTARAMIAAGFRPIPIYPGKKKPMGQDWGLIHHHPEKWRDASIGLGVLLGDLGDGRGLIDIDVDDPERAKPTLDRLFPDGVPDTPCFYSSRPECMHYAFAYDGRLAAYGQTIIKGEVDGTTGEVKGNPHYVGLEIRIGTIDPARPVQEQTLVPPTPRADGSPREWMRADGEYVEPWEVFAHPSPFLPLPDSFFLDLDAYARAATAAADPGPAGEAWDKEEVKAAILPHALALATEWGLRVVTSRPTAKGFLTCRAVDRADADPSAGFNPTTGVYTDRKTGADLSIFQLALALRRFPDFPTMVNTLGRRFGVRPAASKASKASKGSAADPGGGGGRTYDAKDAFDAAHDPEDGRPIPARRWPDPPAAPAWHGPAARLAQAVDPYTEADRVGVLAQLLIGWANLLGRRPYFTVGATRHYLNLFACTTGPTAAGRKGTAWDVVRMALAYCDPEWALNCIKGGMSSGEGLIWEIRDPIPKREPVRQNGEIVDYRSVEADPGVADKRLMVIETEFGGTLKVLTREGNNLSALIRQAWDNGMLRTMTKNNPARATDALISIVGHITEEEVNRFLSETDAANGFANRFLWLAVRQSKHLPRGGLIPSEPIRPILDQLSAAAAFAANDVHLSRTEEAEAIWEPFYSRPAGKQGLLGAILGRRCPLTMRLACIYALMDLSAVVRPEHVEAAIALWDFCERSATYIFGDQLGDRDADNLLSALRSSPLGLDRTQIYRDVFGKHKSRDQITRVLQRLLESGLVRQEVESGTGGRPRTVFYAIGGAS